MKKSLICGCGIAAGSLLVLGSASRALAQNTPIVGGNWVETWGDEFNTGASDLNNWTYETGTNNGWGNGESENYTNSSNNSYVSGGNLNIAAIASGSGNNKTYTSARINTQYVFSQTYGVIEFRAAMPAAMTNSTTGLWPAVWMMPKNSSYGGWPTSGETDILESSNSSYVQGSLHSGSDSGHEDNQTATYAPAGFDATQFHTYDLVWNAPVGNTAGSIQWYVDGHLYETQTGGWYDPAGTGDKEAPFDKPFYLIINLAVGGNYVPSNWSLADGTYDMQIDYVRAFAVPEPVVGVPVIAGMVLMGRRRRKVQG